MTQTEARIDSGKQEDDLLDSASLIALYGGPGLTHEEMVDAIDPLATLLRDNPHSFLGHIHSLADNYLTSAYRNKTGVAPDRSKIILGDIPAEVKPLLVPTAIGEVAERNPFEAALHFLPLTAARTIGEKYGSIDGTKGLTATQIRTAVEPLVPLAEQAKVRMYLGVLAESLIRLHHRASGFTITTPSEQAISPQQKRRGLLRR